MAACTTSRSQDGHGEPSAKAEDSTVVPFDEPAPVARISTGTTDEDAALLTAAATGDPDVMAAAIASASAAACHGAVTCPGFGSCGTWSSTSECGDRQCNATCGKCLPAGDPLCEFPIASTQPTERFRACFNSSGASCIEWGRGASTGSRCRDPLCNDI